MHKRLAVVVAVLAALSLASGAAAATHYFVTNINQIKPSVRAALKGNRGARGLTGTAGAAGAQGRPRAFQEWPARQAALGPSPS